MWTCSPSSMSLVKTKNDDPERNEPFAGAFREVWAELRALEKKAGRKRPSQDDLAEWLSAYGMRGRDEVCTKQQSVSSWLKSDGSKPEEPEKLISYLRTTQVKTALIDALERTLPVKETVDKPSNVEQLNPKRVSLVEANRPTEIQSIPAGFEGFPVRNVGRHPHDGGLILITGAAASSLEVDALSGPKEYAFRHSGNEMSPRHKQGELLFVSASADRRPGDTIVVFLPPDGEGQRFFVREYVEEDDGGITVRTIKNATERTFSWSDSIVVHLVVGSSYKS